VRAMDPRESGYAENQRDGVRCYFEVFGPERAETTVVALPTWSLVHSRSWKMQIPFLAHAGVRVVVFDPRGNGESDIPERGYTTEDYALDALAVMDRVGVERAVLLAYSAGGSPAAYLAAEHPSRVERVVMVAPSISLSGSSRKPSSKFTEPPPDREEWNKYNAVHWRDDLPDFARWFAGKIFTEPHSTKGVDDIAAWSTGTTAESLIATVMESATPSMAGQWPAIGRPVLIVHGSDDRVIALSRSLELQEANPRVELTVFEGGGHGPHLRDPVRFNLLLRESLERREPARDFRGDWRRAQSRKEKRALFVSSPIGLGHSQRDVAIAKELRLMVPDLEIDWLAQHPVTRVLEANDERIHPASALLAGESPHIESLMGSEHELNVFQAIREMDEILLANFHVFHDVAKEGNYDLWVGDEAWEVDYHLHENPELKTAPFAWLTDFVGYLPMVGANLDGTDDGGREAFVTADYNAEMIEQVERFKRVRDAAIYIGSAEDVVPDNFGPGLPRISDWLGEHFDFNGYIRYFDPAALGDRQQRRARFDFSDDEKVMVAAVGGTSVGSSLLRRIVESYPEVAAAVPGLRLIVVCGPRIDPASLPQVKGVEYRGYVHDLYQLLAAADAALVQGGLSTTMELVAAGTPFLYFPLTNHFEQNRHVAHRLARYGVPEWTRVAYQEATPEILAERVTRLLREPPTYRPVEAGGARLAAERIAALL